MAARLRHIAVALLCIAACAAFPVRAQETPTLTRYVNDFAAVLPPAAADELNARLRAYDEATSSQFVVVVLRDLQGESIEDAALRIAEKNGIGRSGRDNGLLFLVSIGDRKMRFEVGYGLEGALTDALTSSIIRDAVVPRFREGDYAGGISAGMDAAMKAAQGEYTAPERKPARREKKTNAGSIIFFIILIIIVVRAMKKGRGGRGGGIFFLPTPFGGFGSGGGSGWSSGSDFGGFSGGGGSFGGGGSSGDW